MGIDARLDKLMPVLSARERAILVLRSLKEKTPKEPSWRNTMPREQWAEFNRLIVLMNACNIYLPLFITMVEQRTEQLYVRFMWWDTLVDSGLQLWKLAQLIPANKRRQAEKAVAK